MQALFATQESGKDLALGGDAGLHFSLSISPELEAHIACWDLILSIEHLKRGKKLHVVVEAHSP